jgi:WD40 repeat protein/tRNA A-37 threonylcarbamoyl transferase component Bud32
LTTPEVEAMNERMIFANALQKDTDAERAAYLEGACGDNAEMRQRIEELIAEQAELGSFLESSPPDIDATADFEATSQEPGVQIGRYKLLQQIGEGGFGSVWMAEQTEPVKRRVALKIIKLGMDTREVIARFEAERQALAMMDHPNIAKVLDAGATENGRPFFVMELIKGIPVTEFCDESQLDTKQRLELFTDVCSAINHAHQKGVIHRDIKPSNILVTLHGDKPVPKVIDFGIAKATQHALTDKTLFTRFEQFIGTPVYMSPEQAALSGLDIDTRSDIYALGVLLYELLTGKPPFDSKTLVSAGYDEMRRIIREEEPARPSVRLGTVAGEERTTLAKARHVEPEKLSRLVKGELDWIVMKAIEKDRARRYETANAFTLDIRRFLADEPVTAVAPSAAYRFRKFARRNRAVLGVAAAISLLLVAGVAVSTWQAVRATRAELLATQTATAEQAARIAEAKQRQSAESNAQQARLNLYAADMNLAQAAVKANNFGRAARLLDRHIPKEGEEDLRHWEWRYLWRQIQGDELYSLPAFDSDVFNIDHSPDGRHLAIALFDGRILICDLQRNRQVKALTPASGEVAKCLYSPDGATLIGFHHQGEGIRRWDARTLAEKSPLTAPESLDEGGIRDLSVSQDGRFIAAFGWWRDRNTGHQVGKVIVWDGDSGDPLWAQPGKVTAYHTAVVSFSADASKLFVGETDGRIRRLDRVTGEIDKSWLAHGGLGISALAVSPDGKILASGSAYASGDVKLWDADTGDAMATLTGHGGWVSWLEFSADGEILASASADQTARIWNMGTLTTQSVLRGHRDELYCLSFSPDAPQLITGSKDGSVSVWSTQPKEREEQHVSRPIPQQRYYYSPNGEYLFVPTETGTILELDPVTLEDVGVVEDFGTTARLVFSSDSKQIFVSHPNTGTKVFDLRTRTIERTLDGGIGVDYMPKVNSFVSYLPKTREIVVWDLSTWEIVATFPAPDNFSLREEVSSDGKLAAYELAAGFVSVVRVSSGFEMTPLTKFKAHRRALSGMAFSPDDRLFATVAQTGLGFLWNTDDWTQAGALRGHAQGIHGVGFSPDSRRVITCSAKQDAIKLWDTASHQEVMNLAAEGTFFRNPAYLEDGRTLAATSVNTRKPTLHVWRASTWEEIAEEEAEKARRANSQ